MVKVVIGGTPIEETPLGWLGFTTTLRMDRELKALFEIVEVPLTFYFDGYTLLKNAFDANGYCYSLPVTIYRENAQRQYIVIFNGTLFFKDIEFTEGVEGYSAKCQLTDNSFFAKIYNNRNLRAKIYMPRSKSDVAITAAAYSRSKFFNPTTGTYYSHLSGPSDTRNDTAFRVYDVLRFLVDFMSDGEVNFESDFFAPGGEGEGAMITCGKIPRFTISGGMTQDLFEEIWPDLSFSEVLSELDKVYNLGVVASFNGATPTIRIEELAYLRPNTTLLNMADVEKLKRKTALEYLPAKLKVGSEIVTDDTGLGLSFPSGIRYLGTKQEEYILVQDCNTDREENWVNSWIIDTNTIEDLVVNYATVPTTNDTVIILIDCNYAFGSSQDAKKSNWLAIAPPYYYNEAYTNANKALRHLGSVPASIAAYLSATDDTFTAESTNTDPAFPLYYNNGTDPERLIECDSEITDPSSNYNNAAFYYDIPTTGVYTFYGLVKFELYNNSGTVRNNNTTVFLRRTDSSNVLISETAVVSIPSSLASNTSQIFSISGTAATIGNATDRIYLYIKVEDDLINYRIYTLAQYGCTATSNGGGVYQEYDPNDFPIIRNQFEYPITFTQFLALKAQPLGLLSFGVANSKTYFAWIEEIKYKHFGEASSFTLISNETTN